MRILMTLFLFSLNTYSMDLILEEQEVRVNKFLNGFSNADGSFGEEEKEILSSVVLLQFLAHGETPTSRLYGNVVKKAMQYLCARSEELIKAEKLSLKDAYVAWALSESYAMTGIALIEKSAEKMLRHLLKHCNDKKWLDLDKESYAHFNFILSNAYYSASIGGLEAIEGVSFKEMMTKVVCNFRSFSRMDFYDRAIMNYLQLRWMINHKDVYFSGALKNEYTKEEKKKVEDFLRSLNADSKTRKTAYKKAMNLDTELLALLLKKLSESEVVELKEAGKDLRLDVQVAYKLENWEDTFDNLKNSPSKLLPATLLYFSNGGNEWRSWNRSFQKHLVDLQKQDGTWPENLAIPSDIKIKGKDKILFNTAYAALNLTVYYRYLPSFKVPRGQRKFDLVEEEGLDLID